MKELKIGKMSGKQGGFTIIELIVVILLLGILTATALPRFLDISDDAHGAVVDAVEGSLRSGVALYRAGWVAGGQNTGAALTTFGNGNLWPSTGGYPADAVDGTTDADATDCLAVFSGLVELGGMTAGGVAAPLDGVTAGNEDAVETAATTNDWVIAPDDDTTPTGCEFYYTGQYKSGTSTASNTIRRITYVTATGALADDTVDLELD